MPLERIESKRKSYEAVEQLVKLIETGEFSKGDKLPPERVVSEKLGISRPLVREAYSALQLVGVIQTKVGDGTYVTKDNFSSNEWSKEAFSLLEEEDDPCQVWQARESVESGSMNLAVEKATSSDITSIQSAFREMEQAVSNEDYDGYFEADRAFHVSIAKSTHNPYLQESIESLVKVMEKDLWREIKQTYFLEEEDQLSNSLESHRAILDSIRKKDKSEATRNMYEHFQELKSVFGS